MPTKKASPSKTIATKRTTQAPNLAFPSTAPPSAGATAGGDDVLAQALTLKQQYEALLGQARENALTKIQSHLDTLKQMGFAYQLTPLTPTRPSRPTQGQAGGKRDWRRPPKSYDPSKRCTYCNIEGHDARAHRGQAPSPRPFTTDELREQNYLPPTQGD